MGRANTNNPNGYLYKQAKKILTGNWMTIKDMIENWPAKRVPSTNQLHGAMQVWPLKSRLTDSRTLRGVKYPANEYTWDLEQEKRWLANKNQE